MSDKKTKIVGIEDLQVVTDILAKLDTNLTTLNTNFNKLPFGITADLLELQNNIDSVRSYIHWIGLTLFSKIPTQKNIESEKN